ncbi:MAG TPA: MBL fold metallo-hydrolase [Baekduia sp.]|nr:MBL fold metallo-hydrolase [Baekduia sp.]
MLAAATILGSGGFVPTERRETSSLLLLPEDGDTAVVVDAGTGLRRLVTDPELLQGRSRLEILLSHFHIDHVCGLAYLTERSDLEIRVHGPGRALYDTPTDALLARLFSPPIMPIRLGDIGVEVAELATGAHRLGGLEIAIRRQDRHSNPTLGLRFGDDLAWCTDTEDDEGTVAFARGARVLAHDAWHPPAAPGHATPAAAGRVAAAAGVEQLVLIHVPPTADDAELLAGASAEHERVVVATDGLSLLAG